MRFVGIAIFVLCCITTAEARTFGLQFGIGNWYSDDLRSSYQYGGGVLFKPGLEWLEFSASLDRAPAQVKSDSRYAAALKDTSLSFWRLGVSFPSELEVFGLKAYMFPLFDYVATSNADDLTHGFGIGGGLEFILWRDIIGARFEALEQMYCLPTRSARTGVQEDFFFALRLTASL